MPSALNESRGDRVDVADAHFDTHGRSRRGAARGSQRVFWVKLSWLRRYVLLGLLFWLLFVAASAHTRCSAGGQAGDSG